MSDDSSSATNTSRSPLGRKGLFGENGWGIIGAVIIGLLAIAVAPIVVLFLFGPIIADLPVAADIQQAIAHMLVLAAQFAVVWLAMRIYGKSWAYIGLAGMRIAHIGPTIAGFVVYFGISVALAIAVQYVPIIDPQQPQELGYSQSLRGLELLWVLVPIVVLTPFVEEVIFRGMLFKGFRRYLPFWATALLVSILFGVAHGQWNVGIDVFALSLVACYLVEKTGSLWPAIWLHVLKNAIAFCLIFVYNGS